MTLYFLSVIKETMSRNLVVTTVVVILVLGLGWWFLARSQKTYQQQPPYQAPPASSPKAASSPKVAASPSASPAAKNAKNIVKIQSSGFVPQSITVKAGEMVTWVNSDSVNHDLRSAVHPTHLVYPPLNLGLIKPGEEKSLSFPKAGTYKYHDHLNPSSTGSVTVE